MKILRQFTLTAILLLSAIGASAQSDALERGIEHYRQGQTKQAILVLENLSKAKDLKNEPRLWNYLGLAYIRDGAIKKGRQALEKAVKFAPQNPAFLTNLAYAYILEKRIDKAQTEIEKALKIDPQNVAAYYLRGTARLREKKLEAALADAEKIISIDANYAAAYLLKADTLIAFFGNRVTVEGLPQEQSDYLQKAVETLETCIANCQKNEMLAEHKEKAEAIRAFRNYFNKPKSVSADGRIIPDPNLTPISFLSKPRPNYTDEARRAGIGGTIRLAVLFSADGEVSYTLVLNSLGYGLDRQAIIAAQRIKFEPARLNGQPISVVRMVEYSFTIY